MMTPSVLFDPKESPFSQVADRLIAAGYTPIPIIPRDKAPGEYVGGRWTFMRGWNNYSKRKPEQFKFDIWKKWPDANVGITLGTPVGGYQLIAIDFDTDDHGELQALQSQLPPSRMVKRGMRGYTAFYRAGNDVRTKRYMIPVPPAPGEEPKKRCVLEILTGNQPRQTVMPPSIHPHGRAYSWETSESIVPIGDLPVLADYHFEQLEDTLEHLGWNGELAGPRRDHATKRTSDDDSNVEICREVNDRALANLNAWVPVLNLHRLRKRSGGYSAVAHWRESGTGRPLEQRKRNLSIYRTGISDFGDDRRYTPLDLTMAATGLGQDAAFAFLYDRTGLKSEIDNVIDWEAVTANLDRKAELTARRAAAEERWRVAHQSIAARPGERQLAQAEDDSTLTTGVVIEESSSDADDGPDEFPEALTKPEGLLGNLVDWITATSQKPIRALALGPAIVALGALAGNRVVGPTGTGTHLYIAGLAPSGSGKEHGRQMVAAILRAANAGHLAGPEWFKSDSAIQNALFGAHDDVLRMGANPVMACAPDEIGDKLKAVFGKNSGAHLTGVGEKLLTLWSGNPYQIGRSEAWANRAAVDTPPASFSIYGVSTEEKFFGGLSGREVIGGFLNRWLIIKTCHRMRRRSFDFAPAVVPDEIVAKLNALFVGLSSSSDITVTGWTLEARGLAESLEDEIFDLTANSAIEPFYARTIEHALRLATICAVGINWEAPVIDAETFAWARKVATWSARSLMRAVGQHIVENDRARHALEIKKFLAEEGRGKTGGLVSRNTIVRRMQHRLKGSELADLLKGLIDSQEIEAVRHAGTGKTGRPPAEAYRLLRTSK
jgi:hypothetical protein